MRGPDIGAKKPGEKRVLFLGDSLTEELQVPPKLTFASLVADELRARGVDVTPVNGGRSGASPAAYIYLASWYKTHIQPDVVVIQLSDLDFTVDLMSRDRNFYVEQRSGKLHAVFNRDFVSANRAAQRWPAIETLLEVPLFRVALDNLNKLLGERTASADPAAPAAQAQGGKVRATSEPDPGRAEVDWVIESLKAAYGNPVLVYVPTPDYTGDLHQKSTIEQMVIQSAKAHGVAIVDNRAELADEYYRHHRVAYGFNNTQPGTGHLNAEGNKLMARALEPALLRALVR
jgi:lysophospholipase L1-like esterase